jgi:hypothetical protein
MNYKKMWEELKEIVDDQLKNEKNSLMIEALKIFKMTIQGVEYRAKIDNDQNKEFLIDFTKVDYPDPNCKHERLELLDISLDENVNEKIKPTVITILCKDCGVTWNQ